MQLLINLLIYLFLSKCMLCTINSAVKYIVELNYTVYITLFISHACISISALIYFFLFLVCGGGKYLICWYSISDFVWLYFILLVPF